MKVKNKSFVIDRGNTSLKWGLFLKDKCLDYGNINKNFDQLKNVIFEVKPSIIGISNVGPNFFTKKIKKFCEEIKCNHVIIEPQKKFCGVENKYSEPKSLGSDRWAALIGAHRKEKIDQIIVCLGTATTIDMLTADGKYLGGFILPGFDLMRKSLVSNTHLLVDYEGNFSTCPRKTNDAITSGAIFATLGAITKVKKIMKDKKKINPKVLLTGGRAKFFINYDSNFKYHDKIILEGINTILSQYK